MPQPPRRESWKTHIGAHWRSNLVAEMWAADCCVPRFAAGGELTDHETGGKREEGLCIHYRRSVTLPVTWEGYRKEYREKVRSESKKKNPSRHSAILLLLPTSIYVILRYATFALERVRRWRKCPFSFYPSILLRLLFILLLPLRSVLRKDLLLLLLF